MYTVKEVAKLLDLTQHTVRFYTDKGLVPSLQRDKNNNRIFNDDSIQWLSGAKKLKKCGMSVEDIKKYVELCLEGGTTIQDRYEIIVKQKELVLAQLEEIKSMAEYITNKEKHYRDIINEIIPDDTNPSNWQNDKNVNSSCPLAKDKMPIAH
ncbi:MerR family transcriptional regulator [Bacillus sp. ISL-46]|uniref:MerR family transcriptional regulator n=1 Tax=Bacillus sp. ISL-46 TaxID=2819129 RepID=UPI001BEB8FAF|nr:MerR family transcriptional regulator [Bacillus sp. ISL-46]MBT2722656.1 MerR family transcriptional regulator [Bacillus sp. ISL-46]